MRVAELIRYLNENYLPNKSDALEFVSIVSGFPYSAIPLSMSAAVEFTDESKALLKRVIDGEPLAYVINSKNFYGYDFYVDEFVLIPRPETEILVDEAICHSKKLSTKNIKILDICTGSGCILGTLLKNLPGARGTGIDLSGDALSVASKNMKKLKVSDRAELLEFDALKIDKLNLGKFDIITCNPPYLSESEWHSSEESLKYEPKMALSAGADSLLFYKKLMDMTPDLCNKNGVVLFEVGLHQAERLRELGVAEKYHAIKDYQQIERVLSWINF